MNKKETDTPLTDAEELRLAKLGAKELATWTPFARRRERENAELRKAVDRILRDFEMYGQSTANHSDGEYTQDYTTRKELLRKALTTI